MNNNNSNFLFYVAILLVEIFLLKLINREKKPVCTIRSPDFTKKKLVRQIMRLLSFYVYIVNDSKMLPV